MEIKAKNTDDSPAINLKITLSYQSENGGQNLIDFGYTDSNGMAIAAVPTNQIFILRAYYDGNVNFRANCTLSKCSRAFFKHNSTNYQLKNRKGKITKNLSPHFSNNSKPHHLPIPFQIDCSKSSHEGYQHLEY